MMNRSAALIVMMTLALASVGAQVDFSFSYREGEMYRYVGMNDQEVILNGVPSSQARILSRVTFQVLKTDAGKGYIKGNIQFIDTRDSLAGPVYQLKQEYPTEFWRDAKGLYTISPHYLVPIVRHVPRFPDRPLSPGDTWVFPGEEVHDMREDFGLATPLRVPMQVYYKYVGDQVVEGKTYRLISVSYDIFARTGFTYSPKGYYPVRMTGSSRQLVLWDLEAGRPESYEEEYSLFLHLNTGDVFQFNGKADSRLVEAPPLDRTEVVQDLRKTLDDLGYQDAEVRPAEKGVTISLDDIVFEANTSRLLPGEEKKLEVIARILAEYPGRDVLVEGHTALAGTPEQRQELSEIRARTVAEYFIRRGVRSAQQMTFRGWGAEKPVADNGSEAGRQRNRRVEITILEN